MLAQALPDKDGAGVAVSPSRLNFNVGLGKSKVRTVKVTNDTKQKNSFKVKINDFNMHDNGKSSFVPAGEGKYGLSKWMSVTPTFFELEPGAEQEIEVTINVPSSEEGNSAAWSILMIEQAKEKKVLDPGQKGDKTIAFGIIPTFAFGVYVYQNPPNVTVNEVSITDYKFVQNSEGDGLVIKVHNNGTGIGFCTNYVTLVNQSTGDEQKIALRKFTILPDLTREFRYKLPEGIAKGKYTATAVVDFGSDEEIEAAQLDFEYKMGQ